MLVDPHRACLELRGDDIGLVEVGPPNRATEAVVRRICAPDGIGDVRVSQDRKDGSELLLAHQAGIVWNVADDRGRDKKPVAIECLPARDYNTASVGVLEVSLDLLVPRLILQRSHLPSL